MNWHDLKKKAVRIGYFLLWGLMAVGLMASLAFVNKRQDEVVCNTVSIDIDPENELQFVDRDMIIHAIRADGNENKIKGTRLSQLNIPGLEDKISRNPYIKQAEVFTDMNGSLAIHIDQREPILRIISATGETYYIDRAGRKMPASPLFTARVAVATGNIFEGLGDSASLRSYVGGALFEIATYVDKHAFWKAQIEQIFVNEASELVLIPKVGNHIIRFGGPSELETKFDKLMLFYKEALSRVGWDKYSVIDLRYRNQVVCKKK